LLCRVKEWWWWSEWRRSPSHSLPHFIVTPWPQFRREERPT
jgi:hypothetical protein